MTSYFPDVNVWMALSIREHVHHEAAIRWIHGILREERLIFSRFTQLGLLRLLTNRSVLGPALNTLEAWIVFDKWLEDPRVEFFLESRSIDSTFRQATGPFSREPASKWIGDCYLLAFAHETDAALVTFDRLLHRRALQMKYAVLLPV
jgi:toxin-antitoxin system PIN domain toxin